MQSLQIRIGVLKVLLKSGSAVMLKKLPTAADMVGVKDASLSLEPAALGSGAARLRQLQIRPRASGHSLGAGHSGSAGLHQALVSRHFRAAGPDQRGRRPVGIKRVSSDNVIIANTVSLLVTSTVRLFPA